MVLSFFLFFFFYKASNFTLEREDHDYTDGGCLIRSTSRLRLFFFPVPQGILLDFFKEIKRDIKSFEVKNEEDIEETFHIYTQADSYTILM